MVRVKTVITPEIAQRIDTWHAARISAKQMAYSLGISKSTLRNVVIRHRTHYGKSYIKSRVTPEIFARIDTWRAAQVSVKQICHQLGIAQSTLRRIANRHVRIAKWLK